MKKVIQFVFPIIITASLVVIAFGFFQMRTEESKLMDDLRRKAVSVADGMELSVRYVITGKDTVNAERLVRKFESKERVQGSAIYDRDGKVIAITDRFKDWKDVEKLHHRSILRNKRPQSSVARFQKYYVYTYTAPVTDDEGNVLGLVEIIYDTSYVFARTREMWTAIIITLIVLCSLLLAISLYLQNKFISQPIQKMTEWFRHFQKGEHKKIEKPSDKGELGKLAEEVEQIALDIKIAKKSMSTKAEKRLKKEDLWTESKLRDLIHYKLGDNAFFVVSNREPYMHVTDKVTGKPKCVRPASGVVTAIDPILRACGGTWVALASGDADKDFVNAKNKLGVPPEDNRYILKRLWITEEEEKGFYLGFANEGIWPLCHITHTRPIFREEDWKMYKEVNQKFADSILEELPANNPMVFIQDYHFTLLPRMIKEKRPDAIIALFWHIPWPNPEVFSICPYQEEILDGMLGSDLIGFHVQYHCNNFMDTANRLLESKVDNERFCIIRSGKETLIRPYPISIDMNYYKGPMAASGQEIERIRSQYDLSGKIVALGVDRIDYTKGIAERALAVDRFLEKNPEYIGKFVFVQLGSPSRTTIKRYSDLDAEIEEIIEKKNSKYAAGNWKPIIYLKRHFSQEEIKPFYALADICIVSSLHDGMNLVSKEYVASKNDLSGTLILSKFTGAAKEFADAIQINPYSIEEFADALKIACEMPEEDRIRRMENMRSTIEENNIYKWAAAIVNDLTSIKREP